MNRSRIAIAIVAAGALVLSACSSNSDDKTSAPTNGSQSSAGQPVDNTSGAAPSAPAPSDSAEGSDTAPDAAGSSTTVTLGGDMDGQTTAWFSSFCTGLTPVLTSAFSLMGAGLGGSGDSTDPQAAKQQLVTGLNSMADGLDSLGSKLKAQAPPTFDHGTELATGIQTEIAKTVPQIKQAASNLQAATVTSSADLQAALQSIGQSLNGAMDDLSLNGFELDDSTKAALAKVPACAPLMSLGDSDDLEPPSSN